MTDEPICLMFNEWTIRLKQVQIASPGDHWRTMTTEVQSAGPRCQWLFLKALGISHLIHNKKRRLIAPFLVYVVLYD